MNEQEKKDSFKQELLRVKVLEFKKAHDELVECAKEINQELMWRVDGLVDDDRLYDFLAEMGIDEIC